MQMNDMILVSVDDHVCEPPDMWKNHVPSKWKDRAPQLLTKEDGTNLWVFEGAQIPNVGLNAVAGRPPEEYGLEPTALSQLRPGCYDVDSRIGDMNANGMLGSLCFPSVPGFVGELFGRQAAAGNSELAITMLRAYNDWHIDDWCGRHPGRFIPLAIPPLWDTAEMAREVRRVAAKGCNAITFADSPKALGYPSLHDAHWDPFWKACSDEGMVVCIHIGSGTRPNMQDVNAPVEVMIAGTPISLFNCALELVFSDVFAKFPGLKIALSEGGIGWIPYFLERIDYITWECDYPHSHSTWPEAPEKLWTSMAGLPDEDIHKITWQNATRHFHYDPFAHIPKEQCTVGALRAQAKHVDLTPRAGGGGKQPSDYARGYATIGDVMKQLAQAISTPFESKNAG
jgi:hypothetical protein